MRNSHTKSPIRQLQPNQRSSLKTPQKSPRASNDKVQVIIRIRPLLKYEDRQHLLEVEDDNTLAIVRPGYDNMYMKFSHILPGSATQQSTFALVTDSINSFLKGINNTIFAYGQTGAGKTYTITGDCPQNIANAPDSIIQQRLTHDTTRGILPRALEMIFIEIHKRKEPQPKILLSFFEIYNEKIYDLYNLTSAPLDIRESKAGEVSIPDLVTVEITELEEAYSFLVQGLKNRVTKATYINSKSSRSHSIFQLTYERTGRMKLGDRINQFRVSSSIRIVDLAGSEKFRISTGLSPAQQDLRIQEVTCINGSLSSLGHCISALIEKSRTHIPFRNSKLTRILSDSLTGNGRLKLIVCISPSVSAAAQTFSTLQFANRAKKAIIDRITTKTSIDRPKTVDIEQFTALMKEYEKEKKTRIELQNILAQSENGDLIEQNNQLQRQNEELRAQLRVFANSQLNAINTPVSNVSPRRIASTSTYNNGKNKNFSHRNEPSQSSKGRPLQQIDGKSFLSLSVLKEDRLHQNIANPPSKKDNSRILNNKIQQSTVSNRRRLFQNKYKKFLDNKSPEKREVSAGEERKSNSPFDEQIRSQLDKIRKDDDYEGKAIKSKEDWFDIDNNSDELNDTREYFVNQTDDEDLFKSQHNRSGSLQGSAERAELHVTDMANGRFN